MGFHWTCTLDFPTEDFLIANCTGAIRQVYERQFVSRDEDQGKVKATATSEEDSGKGESEGAAKKDI